MTDAALTNKKLRGRGHSEASNEELEDDEETNEVVRISKISKRIYSTKNRFLKLSEMDSPIETEKSKGIIIGLISRNVQSYISS